MDEKTAWEKFIAYGRISDYLNYRNIVDTGRRDDGEPFNGRSDNKSE